MEAEQTASRARGRSGGPRRWLGWGKPRNPPRMRLRAGLAAKCGSCYGSCWSRYSAPLICKMQLQMLIQHLLETVLGLPQQAVAPWSARWGRSADDSGPWSPRWSPREEDCNVQSRAPSPS
jgi:hypothetical protein